MERIIITLDGRKVLSVDSSISLEKLTDSIKIFLIEDWKKIVLKKTKIDIKKDKKQTKIEVK